MFRNHYFYAEVILTNGLCMSIIERALSFELLQFGDVLQQAILELMPKFLCDYLKELAVKFTDFVTKCHVLNAAG